MLAALRCAATTSRCELEAASPADQAEWSGKGIQSGPGPDIRSPVSVPGIRYPVPVSGPAPDPKPENRKASKLPPRGSSSLSVAVSYLRAAASLASCSRYFLMPAPPVGLRVVRPVRARCAARGRGPSHAGLRPDVRVPQGLLRCRWVGSTMLLATSVGPGSARARTLCAARSD